MVSNIIMMLLFMQSAWVIFGEKKLVMEKDATDAVVSQEINSLFSSMGSKSAPLYVCDPENGGVEWLPPADIDCTIHPEENDTKRLVNVTLYWSDVAVHKIKAYECVGTRTHIVGSKWIWSKITAQETDEFLEVSPEDCKKMRQDKKSPSGDILHPVTEDVFETSNKASVKPWLFGFWGINVVVDNYKISEINIAVSEADGYIRSTAFTTSPCHYNKSYCDTSSGVLIWEPSLVKTCRLLEGESTECLFRKGNGETTLTCPSLKLFMHDISSIEMCGKTFGTSSTGIYFLTNEVGTVNEKLALPEEVRKLITRPRKKREILDHKVHAFEAEIKANLNYLHDVFNRGTSEAVWKLEKKICEINKKQLETMSAFAQSGHPSLTTRMMYHDPKLRADYSGDLLTVFQCLEIFEYRFLERKNCTFEQPVEYMYENHAYKGFITPITHTIVQSPTTRFLRNKKNCPKFFFKTESYVAQLSGTHAVKINLPALPPPDAAQSFKFILPSLAFKPGKQLNPSSDDDLESMLNMYRDKKSKQDEYDRGKVSHVELLGPFSIITSAGDWLYGMGVSIFDWVAGLFTWGLYFFLAIGILILVNMVGCCKDVIKVPIILVKSIVSVIFRALKCTKIAKKIRRQYAKLVEMQQDKKSSSFQAQPNMSTNYSPSAPLLHKK